MLLLMNLISGLISNNLAKGFQRQCWCCLWSHTNSQFQIFIHKQMHLISFRHRVRFPTQDYSWSGNCLCKLGVYDNSVIERFRREIVNTLKYCPRFYQNLARVVCQFRGTSKLWDAVRIVLVHRYMKLLHFVSDSLLKFTAIFDRSRYNER